MSFSNFEMSHFASDFAKYSGEKHPNFKWFRDFFCLKKVPFFTKMWMIFQTYPVPTVVWNDYLLIFWPNVIFYFTRSWKPNANNQICWITKVSTHSKTLIQFCWKFIYFKDVYWWFLKIWICDKMRALFIFQIIDYAWILIMLFDLCWNW